jgi:cyanuric acid amidohydrolase
MGLRVIKAPTRGPDDLGPLGALEAIGLAPESVVAMVAKSEGNGCVNDFSRTLAAYVWGSVLPASAITVVSGGTEGVLSPHVTLFADDASQAATGLVAAVGRTAAVPYPELGRAAHARLVAEEVGRLVGSLGVSPAAVRLVLVKTPLLTSEKVSACLAAGTPAVATDTYESMACSRRAAALGIALALGECNQEQLDAGLAGDARIWSSVASVSSGAELEDCHILVLACHPSGGSLRARHVVMKDALDLPAVAGMLSAIEEEGGRLIQLFAKVEADATGSVRGRRHTMLTDSDIHSTRHARAAVGGMLAGLVGDGCLYVSAGAEGQGPAGGGPVTAIYEVSA